MHGFDITHDNVARMILRELINIRRDFKHELQKLGDRLENCLTVHASKSADIDSTLKAKDNTLSVPEPENLFPSVIFGINSCAKLSGTASRDSRIKLPICNNHNSQQSFIPSEAVETNIELPTISTGNFRKLKSLNDEVTALEEDTNTLENAVTLFPKSDSNQDTSVAFSTPSSFCFEESLLNMATSRDAPASLLNIAAYPIDSSLRSRIPICINDINNEKDYEKGSSKRKRKYQRPSFKSFQCEICHKAFYTNSNLKSHIETHKGLRPYPCEHCDKKFARKVHLDRHVRLHTGENPYTCAECGKKFSRSDNLKSHLRVHEKRRIMTFMQPALPMGEFIESQELHSFSEQANSVSSAT